MEMVLHGNIYKKWFYNTAPLKSRLIHRGGYRLKRHRCGSPRLTCIRAGKLAEKVETRGLDRVGLWKHPNLEPNIRLLESCGVGGAFRAASRARVAVLRCERCTVERSPDHVAGKAFWTMRQSSIDVVARCPVITILWLSKGVIGLAGNILAVHLYIQTST